MTAKLTFDDEFNSLSLWNGSSGTWDTTFYYDDNNKGSTLPNNGEQEMYTSDTFQGSSDHPLGLDPFSVSNGVLTITMPKTAKPWLSPDSPGWASR